MFQRILVPLDGSERAAKALSVAARLARCSGGTLILVRVAIPASEALWYAAGGMPIILQDSFETAESYLQDLANSPLLTGVKVLTEAYSGSPAEVILLASRKHKCDLIVMCSHGYSGMTRWMLGSVAQKVASHSNIPVLILRHHGPELSHEFKTQSSVRVMVALDGSPLAEAALAPAAYLSDALSAPERGTLHLAIVVVLPTKFEYGQHDNLAQAREQFILDYEKYLDLIKKRLQEGELGKLNLNVTTSITVDPDVAKTLISAAERGEHVGVLGASHILALATHGRSGPARWLMGSIAERVLGTTMLPLLIVRPDKAKIEERDLDASLLGVKV
jgi:nucleotide-binding universal stress UspA family protein